MGSSGPVLQTWGAWIRNESGLPIRDVRTFFHYIAAVNPVSEDWQAVVRGATIERIRVISPRSQKFVPIPGRSAR